MELRVSFTIAAVVLLLTACHGVSSSNALLPTQPSAVDVRAGKALARVLLTLPAIAPPHPEPIPTVGPTRLSSATRSVSGTFGSSKIVPVALTPTTPGCTLEGDGLYCSVTIVVPAGTALLTVSTYASPDGTGKPLATASEQVSVVTGSRNYATPKTWIGLAASYKLAFTKKIFQQGVPSSTVISFYGIDAGGAIIPSNDVGEAGGKLAKAQLQFAGAYPQKIALPKNLPFTSVTFAYDGRLAGSTTVQAISAAPKSDSIYATSTLQFKQGATGAGQLFVQGTGATQDDPSLLLEYAASAAGNAAPLRAYTMHGAPMWANTKGEFWAGPFQVGNLYDPDWLEKYDAKGNGLVRLTPADGVILRAAVDPAENVYTAEGDLDEYDGCFLDPESINVYSAAKDWRKIRGFAPGNINCPDAMAADASGDVFLAYYIPDDSGPSAGWAYVDEYAPNARGASPKPIREFAIPKTYVVGLAVDSKGTVYVQSGSSLLEYPRGSKREVFPGNPIGRFALDAHDNLYVSSNGTIYEYAPGDTSPIRSISLSGRGIGTVEGIAAGP
jgi:hypothetical protein